VRRIIRKYNLNLLSPMSLRSGVMNTINPKLGLMSAVVAGIWINESH